MNTVNQTVKNATKTPMVALTENERTIFNIIVQDGTQSEGKNICADGESNGIELDSVYRVAVSKGKRITSVKGTLSRLQEKGLILMYGRDFECYFDGEVTEKGIEFYNNFSDTAKVLDTKENTKVTNMNTNDLTPAMDERIVKMNAILGTKLSAVSKNKRESIKAQKSSCKFLLDEWDKVDSLERFVSDNEIKEGQYELYCIAMSRIDELKNKRVQEDKPKADFKKIATYKGNPADLSKDENTAWAILHGYYDTDPVMKSELTENEYFRAAFEYREKMLETAVPDAQVKKSVKTTPTAKKKVGRPKGARITHEVGEVHPNGKWVWTEYKPGCFDWRTKKDGRRGKDPNSKASVKKREAQKKKDLSCTFEEFCERAKKRSTKEFSAAQQEIRKLLLRGYKLQPTYGTNLCFLKKGGEMTKSFPFDSVKAVFRKIGMLEIPNEMYESILINIGI